MKKLPIGIQDFGEVIDGNYMYVDKTEHIHRLINIGKYLFFARPRRFGKSLTISTLNEIFTGNKRLFEGLWIADKIDWQPRPVIRIDMNDLTLKEVPLAQALDERIQDIADSYEIPIKGTGSRQKFASLLAEFAKRGRKAAILIDEYDKPITDYLGNDTKLEEIISILKQFYGVINSRDADIHFAFITGVSKFGKVSIFSDLNNLHDLTLHDDSLTLCGYTQQELEDNFGEYIDNAIHKMHISRDEVLAGIKRWYNGYTWDGNRENSVYNPFSMLNFFSRPSFYGYWFETGTPTFLTKLVKNEQIPVYELERFESGELAISAANINSISAYGMLFQTGYLTIYGVQAEMGGTYYTVGYPNEEVRQAFCKFMLGEYLNKPANDLDVSIVPPIRTAIQRGDWEDFFQHIQSLFASIPYHITRKEEAYFHSIMHIVLTITGWRVFSEVATNRGRMDTVLENNTAVYIFEFKIEESADIALAQIRANGYPERYAKEGKKLVFIGVSYSLENRNIREWKVVDGNTNE